MENFSPLSAFAGGVLIGLSALLFLLLNGRIAGISGIVCGVVTPKRGDRLWRIAFIGGMIAAALVYRIAIGVPLDVTAEDSVGQLILAGFLVGLGTRLGNGCTSGHAVCGIARLSRRSVYATLIFTGTAMLTVFVTRHMLGL